MSPNTVHETILVTGVTGYIGAHVARELLQRNYSVRGAVRSIQKAQSLRDGALGAFEGRLSFIEVPDIEVPGAFDAAVAGVHGIVHLASPVQLAGGDPKAIIGAARNGTKTILESAYSCAGPQFSRFVLASSIASILRPKVPSNYVFTEKDWSPFTEEVVEKMGAELKQLAYFASKPIAERVLWEFVRTREVNWSVSAIHPAVVSGPYIHHVADAEGLNDTVKTIWDYFAGDAKSVAPAVAGGAYADVRDVATIFAFAVDNPDLVNGKRLPVVGGYGPTQAVVDILRSAYPERRDIIPRGTPGAGYRPQDWKPAGETTSISSKVIEGMTGIEWIPFDKSIRDTAKCFESLREKSARM